MPQNCVSTVSFPLDLRMYARFTHDMRTYVRLRKHPLLFELREGCSRGAGAIRSRIPTRSSGMCTQKMRTKVRALTHTTILGVCSHARPLATHIDGGNVSQLPTGGHVNNISSEIGKKWAILAVWRSSFWWLWFASICRGKRIRSARSSETVTNAGRESESIETYVMIR